MAEGGCGGVPPDRGKATSGIQNGGSRMDYSNTETYTYTNKDLAPYRVYVELSDKSKQVNKFAVGSILRKSDKYKNSVVDMKYLGRSKLIVFFSCWTKANSLINDQMLVDKGYKAYIPRHLVCITGVIGGVPTEITEKEIRQEIESTLPVVGVFRMTRWATTEATRVPTFRVGVIFRSKNLPEKAKLFEQYLRCFGKLRGFSNGI